MTVRVAILLSVTFLPATFAPGCAEPNPATFIRTRHVKTRSKPHAGYVRVFTVSRPPVPFVEIGIINVTEESYERALYFARVRAAKIGCDAIVTGGSATVPTAVGAVGFGIAGVHTEVRARFTCIVWRRERRRPQPLPTRP